MKASTVVIGIGNPLLKDDRAGIEVAEKLEGMGLPLDVEVVYTVGFEVMDKVQGYETAYVVDACMLGFEPGRIVETDIESVFTTHFLVNSHAITLGTTLKTGYDLFEEDMPPNLKIVLIQVEDVSEFADQCTPKVAEAVDKVVDMIAAEIRDRASIAA